MRCSAPCRSCRRAAPAAKGPLMRAPQWRDTLEQGRGSACVRGGGGWRSFGRGAKPIRARSQETPRSPVKKESRQRNHASKLGVLSQHEKGSNAPPSSKSHTPCGPTAPEGEELDCVQRGKPVCVSPGPKRRLKRLSSKLDKEIMQPGEVVVGRRRWQRGRDGRSPSFMVDGKIEEVMKPGEGVRRE